MANFPVLKTGAAAQYGCERVMEHPATVQKYLDGTTKRFARARARRVWRVRLDGLSAQEAERLGTFIATHFETQERFTFKDPWNGESHANCEVVEGGYRVTAEGEHDYRVEVWIEQRQV